MLRHALSDFDWRSWRGAHRVPLLLQPGQDGAGLISLGPEELQAMIDEQGSADLTCRFCDNVQHFAREDLEALVQGMGKKK